MLSIVDKLLFKLGFFLLSVFSSFINLALAIESLFCALWDLFFGTFVVFSSLLSSEVACEGRPIESELFWLSIFSPGSESGIPSLDSSIVTFIWLVFLLFSDRRGLLRGLLVDLLCSLVFSSWDTDFLELPSGSSTITSVICIPCFGGSWGSGIIKDKKMLVIYWNIKCYDFMIWK